jgi:hypothetical protein
VKASQLPLKRQASILSIELILVKEHLVGVFADDKPISLVTIEPLDRTTLLGQWPLLPEAPKAQQG